MQDPRSNPSDPWATGWRRYREFRGLQSQTRFTYVPRLFLLGVGPGYRLLEHAPTLLRAPMTFSLLFFRVLF